jgi:hypothetical protein
VSDRLHGEGAAAVRFGDRGVEIGGAEAIEQVQKPRGGTAEVAAVQRDLFEESAGARAAGDEAVTSAVLASFSFFSSESREVRFVLDLLPGVPRPLMPRDLLVAVEYADGRVGRDECQRLSDERVRDGVVVAIEANVGRLARSDGLHIAWVEAVLWQRQEAFLLLGERMRDGAGVFAGNTTSVNDALDPRIELPIELGDRRDRARSEERFSKVADPSLDPGFFVAPRDADGRGSEVIVAGKLEDARMEANEVALPLEDDAFQIIVQHGARHPTDPLECFDVAAHETFESLIERETRERRARPCEHHHEAREGSLAPTDADLAERAPVDLGLLGRQHSESKKRLVTRDGPDLSDVAPNGVHAARVAAIPKHLEQARRSQARILLEGLLDECPVRLERRRATREATIGEALGLERKLDGVPMNTELAGDGADLPVLGEEEPPDASSLLLGDHRATSEITSRSRSRKLPSPCRRSRRRWCTPAGTQTTL